MSDYYDELKQEITTLILDKKFDEALFLVKKELQMPYIPSEFESFLLQTKKDLIYSISDNQKEMEESLDSLFNKLFSGKPQLELYAVSKLCDRNLRVCIKEIQDYFSKQPTPEAMALLIDAIAEQEIDEEFTIVKNGVEYSFYGDAITPVSKSKGFLLADKKLSELYVKEPSLLQLAKKILIHKAYRYLPLSYEEIEVDSLVQEIQEELDELFQNK